MKSFLMALLPLVLMTQSIASSPSDPTLVSVAEGKLQGVVDPASGVRRFEGIPFAAPPVGDLRWREPQPIQAWDGIYSAAGFKPRPMQFPLFGDMIFRSPGVSEDCLYLNVWTPPVSKEKASVLVYFYGGGYAGGAADEARYDGAAMAAKGIIVVTVNYRLGIFGFFAHPELTKESRHKASGNYGLLDQAAAIAWVHKNIGAFGGDPKKITIGGESAGSFSVSVQMASPLSKNLIAGAIGESGALFGEGRGSKTLAEAEQDGVAFVKESGARNLTDLRSMSAQQLLDLTKANPFRFSAIVDGYFLPKTANEIYAAGEQAKVPLLAGWNSYEGGPESILGKSLLSPQNFQNGVRKIYGDRADSILRGYPVTSDAEALQAATDLASARFIGYSTWKWIDSQAKTSGKPIYRYYYSHARPGEPGAYHASEIEYVFGALSLNPQHAWTADDYTVSSYMLNYWVNFVKSGDPNAINLPEWPKFRRGVGGVMDLDVKPHVIPGLTDERYTVLDKS